MLLVMFMFYRDFAIFCLMYKLKINFSLKLVIDNPYKKCLGEEWSFINKIAEYFEQTDSPEVLCSV